MNAEQARLDEARDKGTPWRKWGPYLSERQWGTVREDYSEDGNAWDYFTHDQARSRAYRWGEDGLLGISDEKQRLCFALALWNGKDPILKERLFGLTNAEGNHGEDVKEIYFYLDSTPTHSYMKGLYKYPQAAYPYDDLVATNGRRARTEMEYELLDTGVFEGDRYFDVFVEYAKARPEDLLVRITVVNRGPEAATLHLLPTLWFRNTWSWSEGEPKPRLARSRGAGGDARDRGVSPDARRALALRRGRGRPSSSPRTRRTSSGSGTFRTRSPFVKDGIGEYVVSGRREAVNADADGDEGGGVRRRHGPGLRRGDVLRLRLTDQAPGVFAAAAPFGDGVRRDDRGADRRGRRLLRRDHASRRRRRRADRHATGARGDALDEAVLLLRRRPLARGARRPPALPEPEDTDPEPRLVPHGERRRHLHARQVGVPLVRGVGPRLPLRRPRNGRPRFRQAAARS